MKRIKILLLALPILGCSTDDVYEVCECTRYDWEVEYHTYPVDGMVASHTLLDSYYVRCQDEVSQVFYEENKYYTVNCN